jgi:hypothetical protein
MPLVLFPGHDRGLAEHAPGVGISSNLGPSPTFFGIWLWPALSPAHLQKAAGVLLIRFLAGPALACLQSFLKREAGGRATEVQLQAFWEHHNKAIMAALESPEYAGFRLEAFQGDGRRTTTVELVQRLVDLSQPKDL